MFTLPSSGLRKRKEKKTKAKRDKATYCYDRTAKKLPELKIWQEVRIALKIKKKSSVEVKAHANGRNIVGQQHALTLLTLILDLR